MLKDDRCVDEGSVLLTIWAWEIRNAFRKPMGPFRAPRVGWGAKALIQLKGQWTPKISINARSQRPNNVLGNLVYCYGKP